MGPGTVIYASTLDSTQHIARWLVLLMVAVLASHHSVTDLHFLGFCSWFLISMWVCKYDHMGIVLFARMIA